MKRLIEIRAIWLKKKNLKTIIYLGTCLFSIASYQKDNVWKGNIYQENSVTIVENPVKPLYPSEVFKLQEEYVINATGDGYQLERPFELLLDASHNLYVLDNSASNIRVFDDRGRFLRTIGSKGIGPEELEDPVHMTIADNRLTVFSPQIARMTIFDLKGKYIGSQYCPQGLYGLIADSHGNLIGMNAIRTDKNDDLRLFRKYDAKLNILKEIASQVARPYPSFWLSVQGPVFTVTREDKIIYGFPDTYELKIFDNDGRLIGRIRKKHHAVRVPREEIDFIRNKYHTAGFKDTFPEYYEPFSVIESDDEGRLIVTTIPKFAHGIEIAHDVFGPDGRFLATIILRSNSKHLWANSRFYEVAEDEDALPTIKVSRVIWNY